MTILNLNSNTSHLQVWHSTPLIAACHKRYPFQEKSPAIIIWHSSIDEATIAHDLYQDMRGSRNFRQGRGGGGPGPSVVTWQRFF